MTFLKDVKIHSLVLVLALLSKLSSCMSEKPEVICPAVNLTHKINVDDCKTALDSFNTIVNGNSKIIRYNSTGEFHDHESCRVNLTSKHDISTQAKTLSEVNYDEIKTYVYDGTKNCYNTTSKSVTSQVIVEAITLARIDW